MRKTVPAGEKLAYSGGLVGQNMIYNFMSTYIMFFFTDLLGISVHATTVITVVASLWDAVNDPMMGMIADKTRTRWGKFRPYIMIGPVLIALATIFCFIRFDLTGTSAVILAGLAYILWGMSYTVCDIPIWAITSAVSHEPDERNTMVTLGKIGGTIGTVIVTVFGIMIINAFGGARDASAYTSTAVLIAVIGCALMMIAGFKVKERIRPDSRVMSIKENLKTITVNRPLQFLMIALILTNMVNNIRQNSQMYFVEYVWEDAGLLTPVGASLVVGMTLGMAVTPALIKRMSKKRIFVAAAVAGTVVSSVPFFADQKNVVLGLIFLGFSFACTGVTTIVCSSMLLDAVEYSEYRLGYRGDGLIFSLNTFLNKLSAAISRLMIGLGLSAMAYTENAAVTPQLQNGFSAMMYLIPAASCLLSLIPIYFYRLTDDECRKIHEEVEKRREVQ